MRGARRDNKQMKFEALIPLVLKRVCCACLPFLMLSHQSDRECDKKWSDFGVAGNQTSEIFN